jgi:tetratricopeptide (TPR) repeat protein
MAQTHLGLCRYLQGRYQEALEMTRAAEDERSSWGTYQIALCQLHVGDISGAIQSAERGAMRFLGDPAEHSLRGLIAARQGDAAAARNHIALTVASKRSFGHYHHTQYDVACIWAMLGEKEKALDWLTDAARNGFPCYSFFQIDSMLESVRGEARFTSLIEELKAECDGYRL